MATEQLPPNSQLGPPNRESIAVAQWKRLFASGQRKRRASWCRPQEASTKAKRAEQLYLDLGQRSFGKQQQCKICGMLYTEGEPEDEETHQRFHHKVVQGLSMHPSGAERMVRALPEGGRVVLVLPCDPPDRLRRLREVTRLMAADLGSEPDLPPDGRAFLLVGGHVLRYRLLGCAIAEPLQSAYCAVPLSDSAGTGVLRHDGVPQPALCGVTHIWVARAHRRQGIARRLLDAVR